MVDIRPETTSHRLASLAERQHGVVARRQLASLGATPSMIKGWVATGRLARLHPGVYAVGHRQLRREGHQLAALLWAGPGAALSHRDAAALHGLWSSSGSRIHVTATRRPRGTRPGVDVHHTAVLGACDVTVVAGMPATTVERTLVDLAGVLPRGQLARALREAEHLLAVDMGTLRDAMRRTRTRKGPGQARLAAVLEEHRLRGTQLTRSVLEERFLTLCAAHGLPRPRTNFHVEGLEVDACWPAHRLVVELDGWTRHKDRHAFQRDRSKGNELLRAGWRVLRFTHDDVVRRPAETTAEIRHFLAGA